MASARSESKNVRNHGSYQSDTGRPDTQGLVCNDDQVIQTSRSLHASRRRDYGKDHPQDGTRRHSGWEAKDKHQHNQTNPGHGTESNPPQTCTHKNTDKDNQELQPDHEVGLSARWFLSLLSDRARY